jgi:hypothetical protein
MSRTLTRKQLITEKYSLLIQQLTETGLLSNDLFPSLDDIEVSDLIFFFQVSFPDSKHYVASIEDLLDCKEIKLKPKDKTKVINIILPFLEIFRQIT